MLLGCYFGARARLRLQWGSLLDFLPHDVLHVNTSPAGIG